VVGFSPDGGWTALLPELIGAARALAIQISNQRIGAQEAVALGLAQSVVEAPDESARELAIAALGKRAQALRATQGADPFPGVSGPR